MDDFLTAAREFDERVRGEINLYDLSVGLLLEYFAWPVLMHTSYVRINQRTRPVAAELSRLIADTNGLDKIGAHLDEGFQVIGRSLVRRNRTNALANRLSLAIMLGVALLHGAVLVACLRAATFTNCVSLLGGWLFAMLLAMVMCLNNHHWTSRARVRGSSC